MAYDNNPSGSIIAANCAIRLANLPRNSRTPITYTLTASAVAVGGTSVAVTVSPAPSVAQPLYIDNSFPLKFGSVTVQPLADDKTVNAQMLTSANGTIKITPATTAVPANATATTRGLLELLGVQNMSITRNSNLISIRSQRSGLGQEQRVVSLAFQAQVSGWQHQTDICYKNVVKPAAYTAGEVYAELWLNDGSLIKAIAGISNLSTPIQLDQVIQMSFDMFIQGIPEETIQEGYGAAPSPSPSPAPVTYDTTIDKNTTTNNGGVTIGVQSNSTTLSFNRQTAPTGVPSTMNVSIGGSVAAAINFQASYNGQPWRFYFADNGQTYNGVFGANVTF